MPKPHLLLQFFAFALAGLLATLLSGCSNDADAQAATGQSRTVAVRAAPVTLSEDSEPLRFAGVVRARQRAQLTFQVGGVLHSRTAEIGQAVEQGEVLATLYNPELEPARNASRAKLAELQAQAAQAQRELLRSEQLFARGVISAQQREQQQARLDAFEASVSSARATLDQTEQLQGESRLRAPFAGRVEALLIEPGEFVTPGQPVMRLAAAGDLEVEVLIPGHMLDDLRVGQAVPVWHRLADTTMRGRISEIGQGSSQGSALYPLVIALEGGSVRTGDGVEVGIGQPSNTSLRVPLAAVMRWSGTTTAAGSQMVYRVTKERAERVPVEVEALRGEWATLRGDALKKGDLVIYAGLTRLTDGDPVELLP